MFFFFQEKDCIRVAHYVLEFRRVLFRSVNKPQSACARFVGGGKAGCPSYPLGIASRRVATASAACCPNCAMKPSSWPSATSAWRPAAMSAQPMQAASCSALSLAASGSLVFMGNLQCGKPRPEEGRVGKEWVSTGRDRGGTH